MCVVVMVRVSPFHSPVENPMNVCGAYSGGCGRPSIQIVRSLLVRAQVHLDGDELLRVRDVVSCQIRNWFGPKNM